MKTFRAWGPGPLDEQALALTLGVFDGLHLGHQALLRETQSRARALGAATGIVTFRPHPASVLAPGKEPPLIMTPTQWLTEAENLGTDLALMLRFDHDLAALSPDDFLSRLVEAFPNLRLLACGHDWRFGKGGTGNPSWLGEWCNQHALEHFVLPPVSDQQGRIASSDIRTSLAQGDIERATAQLGRPFSVTGTVRHGKKLGRKLGFPTANVITDNELHPPSGIYQVEMHLGDTWLPGAAYIPPKTPEDGPLVEVHLLDGARDCYDEPVTVRFLAHIRNDEPFPGEALMRERIAADVAAIRARFGM